VATLKLQSGFALSGCLPLLVVQVSATGMAVSSAALAYSFWLHGGGPLAGYLAIASLLVSTRPIALPPLLISTSPTHSACELGGDLVGPSSNDVNCMYIEGVLVLYNLSDGHHVATLSSVILLDLVRLGRLRRMSSPFRFRRETAWPARTKAGALSLASFLAEGVGNTWSVCTPCCCGQRVDKGSIISGHRRCTLRPSPWAWAPFRGSS
jgi:hypothetical protein